MRTSLDARLRAALLNPRTSEREERILRLLVGALILLAFFALMMTRTLAQAEHRAYTVALLCLPLAVMLLFALRLSRDGVSMLLMGALCAAAMLARVSFIERSAGDYEFYLAGWMGELAHGSFAEGMQADVGEYNVLYQYILFILTRLPVPALYAVKAVSFVGDGLLAGAAASLAACGAPEGEKQRRGAMAFGVVLLLPTVVLNGGMFAQCDSLYACCALWGLALSLTKKPMRAAVCWGLALAFKLQAVFLLPIVLVLWADERLSLRDAGIFLLTLLLTELPALLGGKRLLSLLTIYTAQMGLYTGLNYGAANLFGLMETEGLDVYAYGNFAMALAFGACALLVYGGLRHRGRMTEDGYVRLALLLVVCIVFLLPRMHERYFYMAGALSAALACRRGRRYALCAVLIEAASLSTYWALGISLPAASLMMLAAGAIACAE